MALQELVTLQGSYGVASGAWGSAVNLNGTISVSIPVGATVVSAYVYTSVIGLYCYLYSDIGSTSYGTVAVDGDNIDLTTIARFAWTGNPATSLDLVTRRGICTSTIAAIVDGGPGGVYEIDVAEYLDAYVRDHYPEVFDVCTNFQDGIALVIVYEHPDVPNDTIVAIYDGTQEGVADEDEFEVPLPAEIDPTLDGFGFEMRVGVGFSCCSEATIISINGERVTGEAGNNDSSEDYPAAFDGGLITMGGELVDFAPAYPSTDYTADHERYDVTQFLTDEAPFETVTFHSENDGHNDNLFVAVFLITPGDEDTPEARIITEPVEIAAEGDAGTEARIVTEPVEIVGSGWVSTPTEIGRLRRFPHLSEEHQRIKVSMLELEYQRSVAPELGDTPQIRLRVSRDGGQTYGTPMFKTAGVLGLTNQRAKYNRLGQGRDYVFELFVQDPVFWSFEDCYLQADKGTS